MLVPIYPGSATDAAERRVSVWAAAGVTSSLAAAGAQLLGENPSKELPPRLRNALSAMRQEVNQIREFAVADTDVLLEQRVASGPYPELLMTELAVSTSDHPGEVKTQAVDVLTSLLQHIDELLEHPTTNTARLVEEYLSRLSQVELEMAQAQLATEAEVELSLRPAIA
jgi:hypothetical protein